MKITISCYTAALICAVSASPLDYTKRQSTTWRYECGTRAPPSNFKAFNLDGCSAQLDFDKDQYVGVQWAFEATYVDGNRLEHKPFRNFNSFGVSDTFYPYLGNNFITSYPSSSAFTAVHEFANICKGGQPPTSWRFYTTSANSACSSSTYQFTTNQVRATNGVSRPAQVSGVSLRRSSDAGDFLVSWSAVPSATAYSVIVQYPTGSDEIGGAYLNVRGARVQVR
jgi:hypothetical protein